MQVRKLASKDIYRKKRVAAYARVSTMQECQEDSFETQVKYYETLIKNTPNWTFIKVYADHGFSGVSAENRPGFMEMVRDAKCREFDILLVRSISRFARNVKEAQVYCRELKNHGIEVRFEKERVSSNDPTAELAFNLLASCAQEESRATSERTKWSYKEHAKMGIRHIGSNHVLGYDEVNGVLTPNKDAWIIRKIFESYTDGFSIRSIVQHLNNLGVRGMRNHKPLTGDHLKRILNNEIYVGDRCLQKAAHSNYMTHKPDWLQPYDSYYIRDSHEGIIGRELWDKVAARLEEERSLVSEGVIRRQESHFLYGKVFCGVCGCPMRRKMVNACRPRANGTVDKVAVWKCTDRLKGKKGNGCKNDILKESALLERICEQLDIEVEALEETVDRIDRIIVTGEQVEVLTFAEKRA